MGLLFGCFKLGRRNSTVQPDQNKAEEELDSGVIREFGWEEIKVVTDGFSRVIGRGGFSNVYLANSLSGSNQLGAVKVFHGCCSDRLNQVFKQELDILIRLRHRNIVRLLGYCDDLDEGAMVFEYVPNGNLQEKLHENDREVLSWKTRTAIAFQLAQAIEYLHEKCSLQIVHGDIKPSNVLLDESFNCKLCDFGSAKMGFSSTVTPPSSSGRTKQLMVGSLGYTDPHYLRTGLASKKNDVYSLGVVLLELVTGMKAFCPGKGYVLTSIVAEGAAEEKVAGLVDPRLGCEFDLEEAKALVSIAALCLDQSLTVRPSVSQIIEMMEEKITSIDFLFSTGKIFATSNV